MTDCLTPAALGALDQAAFTAFLGGIYEHSPWIPERSWAKGPFASRAALQAALAQSVDEATVDEKLGLIRAHPELAGKAAVRGELTDDSTREQAGAGLDQCTQAEFEHIQRLNHAYGAKFGFPFIVAVKGLDRHAIIAAVELRLERTPAEEFAEALTQIHRIAALRLPAKVSD